MSFNIKEQPNVFDDAFLDIIGNEFKFDHVKGLAEWIKNSADAYTRADVPDASQYYLPAIHARRGAQHPAAFISTSTSSGWAATTSTKLSNGGAIAGRPAGERENVPWVDTATAASSTCARCSVARNSSHSGMVA